MPDEIVIKRLAFIKYLYNVGIEQSQRPEPLCSASILTFHDAIELFLQLASEHLNVGRRDIKFLEYWDLISPQLPGNELTQKESMRRLNRARVALKHHGTMPSKLDIEAFRGSTTNFFEDNTRIVFGIRFTDISLVDLVQCKDAKNNLKEAGQMLKKNKIEDALNKAALAFYQVIDHYESKTADQFGRSRFFFGKSMTFLDSFSLGVNQETNLDAKFQRKLTEFVDKVKESVETLQNAVKILSLGIDYRRYSKFRLVTPIIWRSLGGKYYIHRFASDIKPTPGDVQFCINFVIETAIILQQFDFSIKEH